MAKEQKNQAVEQPATTVQSTEAYLLGILDKSIACARQASGTIKRLDELFPGRHEAKTGVIAARNRANEIINMVQALIPMMGREGAARAAALIDGRFKKFTPPAQPAQAA